MSLNNLCLTNAPKLAGTQVFLLHDLLGATAAGTRALQATHQTLHRRASSPILLVRSWYCMHTRSYRRLNRSGRRQGWIFLANRPRAVSKGFQRQRVHDAPQRLLHTSSEV
eukprot:5378769-Pleurochrysis_carterae.AAC.2